MADSPKVMHLPARVKVAFYLLLFGVLTLYFALFRPLPPRQEYTVQEVLGAGSNLYLFVEPDEGRAPLLTLIASAESKLLTTVYLFSDREIINGLAEAQNRGAEVKVILEDQPFTGGNLNRDTRTLLESAGITVRGGNPAYALTHQKSVIFDNKIACILNTNLTKAAFTTNREYNICTVNPEEVAEAVNIFAADWERKDYQPKSANLIVSPVNSRAKLTAFIKSAQKSLDIEIEVLTDEQIIALLTKKAKTIPVRILLPDPKKIAVDNKLRAARLELRTLARPYPHAKLIIADGIRAYIGSINLTAQSLDENRELGILVSQPDIIPRLNSFFAKDWEKAK